MKKKKEKSLDHENITIASVIVKIQPRLQLALASSAELGDDGVGVGIPDVVVVWDVDVVVVEVLFVEVEVVDDEVPGRISAGVTVVEFELSALLYALPSAICALEIVRHPLALMTGYAEMKAPTVWSVNSCSRIMRPGFFDPVSH